MTPQPLTPQPNRPPTSAAVDADPGAVRHWLKRRARVRRVRPRARRALASALRQAADPINPSSHFRPRRRVLRYRVAAVRGEMFEIAALLEHAQNADPSPVDAVRELLRDRNSPLYDVAVDVTELRTTLEGVRNALTHDEPVGTHVHPLPREPGA